MSRALSSLLLTVSLFTAAPAVADNAPVKTTSTVVKAQPVAPIKAAPPVAVVNSPAPASSPTASPAVASAVSPDAKKSGGPAISSPLTKMLSALPLANMKDKILGMVADLKKTSCGNGLSGCYSAKSGEIQLYFFTSNTAQQTFLLVLNTKLAMPSLLKENVQKMLIGTELIDPIISISTADFALSTSAMPPDLQKIVKDSYFNVDSLSFTSGVQIEGRANIAGSMNRMLKTVGVHADKLILSAGVVLPIPTDLAGAAGAGAGLAQELKDGESMSNGLKKAATPEAYVALQMGPNEIIHALFGMDMDLTDAAIQFSNSGVLTVKGNALFNSVPGKKMPLVLHTPVDPAGALDFLDFEFRLATPSAFTMQGGAMVMTSFMSPLQPLVQYGGSFIKGMDKLKKPLLTMTQPLSVIQLKNPQPPTEYKFGDSTKPFPTNNQFNFVLLGPLTSGGPLLKAAGDVRILGQTMGSLSAQAGINGFQGTAEEVITVKLGPLGKTGIRMKATADISTTSQLVTMNGNVLGRSLLLTMNDHELKIDSPATCATPFEIRAKATITPDMDIAKILDLEAGANVDPSLLQGCIGADLKRALGLIGNEYKALSGYTASQANQALKQITDSEAAAAKAIVDAAAAAKAIADKAIADKAAADKAIADAAAAAKAIADKAAADKAIADAAAAAKAIADKAAADKAIANAAAAAKAIADKAAADKAAADAAAAANAARLAYQSTKNAARNVANNSSNAANNALKSAGNIFRGFGKKKRHSSGPDPKFASSVFDWDYYYDIAPDVVSNGMDLSTHWHDMGFAEGRRGSLEFYANYYYNRYIDVQRLCPGNLQCALQHWLDYGLYQGRQGSPDFSIESYLIRYPDLMAAFPNGDFPSAFEHWFASGKDEGRSASPVSGYSGQLPGPLVVGGGRGDALWSDFNKCAGQYVNGFRVRASGNVDSLQFSYSNMGWADVHGNPTSTDEVMLPAGEYFVKVDFGAGDDFNMIKFTTNLGRTFGPYGRGSNGSFTVATGEKLGCMAGRSDSHITQLIFTSTGPQ